MTKSTTAPKTLARLGESPDFSLFWLSVAHFVSRNWVVVSSGIGGCVGFLLLLS